MNLGLITSFVVLLVSLSFAQVSWQAHIMHDYTNGTSSVHACDVDNDGDPDVLGAVLEDNDIVWWRNEGGNPIVWTKFAISYNFAQAFSVYGADIDNDGDQDVIGAAGAGDEIAWWSNDSGTGTHWTKRTIRAGYDFAHEVYAHDLDEDGDMDVFGASSNLDVISWWRNDGGSPIQWTEQTIGADFDGAKSIRVADLDADGDNDVIGACIWGNAVTWWRNDGGNPIQWTRFDIDTYFYGAHRVQAVDLDEDGDVDILAAGYLNSEIAWYSNEGGNPLTWTKHTIEVGLYSACIAQAADLDNDGDLDVAATGQTSHQIRWWRNDGGSPIVWTRFYIDEYLYRAWPLYVCDLDGDGDQDAVAASSWAGTAEVKWYENSGAGILSDHKEPAYSRSSAPTIIRSSAIFPLGNGKRLLDITGREVRSSSVTPGIYFIEVDGEIANKIVVVK